MSKQTEKDREVNQTPTEETVPPSAAEQEAVETSDAGEKAEESEAAAALEEQASRLTQAVSAFRLAASPLTNKPQTPSRPASEQPPAQPRLRIAEQDPNWETF